MFSEDAVYPGFWWWENATADIVTFARSSEFFRNAPSIVSTHGSSSASHICQKAGQIMTTMPYSPQAIDTGKYCAGEQPAETERESAGRRAAFCARYNLSDVGLSTKITNSRLDFGAFGNWNFLLAYIALYCTFARVTPWMRWTFSRIVPGVARFRFARPDAHCTIFPRSKRASCASGGRDLLFDTPSQCHFPRRL